MSDILIGAVVTNSQNSLNAQQAKDGDQNLVWQMTDVNGSWLQLDMGITKQMSTIYIRNDDHYTSVGFDFWLGDIPATGSYKTWNKECATDFNEGFVPC